MNNIYNSIYKKIPKNYLNIKNIIYEDIKQKLKNGENLFLDISFIQNNSCLICNKKNDGYFIINSEQEDNLTVLYCKCKNCNQNYKFYILDNEIIREELYFTDLTFKRNKIYETKFKFKKLLYKLMLFNSISMIILLTLIYVNYINYMYIYLNMFLGINILYLLSNYINNKFFNKINIRELFILNFLYKNYPNNKLIYQKFKLNNGILFCNFKPFNKHFSIKSNNYIIEEYKLFDIYYKIQKLNIIFYNQKEIKNKIKEKLDNYILNNNKEKAKEMFVIYNNKNIFLENLKKDMIYYDILKENIIDNLNKINTNNKIRLQKKKILRKDIEEFLPNLDFEIYYNKIKELSKGVNEDKVPQ